MVVHFRIVGSDLPGATCGPSPDKPDGYRDIHVGVQRGQEVIGLVRGDAPTAVFEFEANVRNHRFTGPFVHGRGAERFVYLSWGEWDGETFAMFRRAKLQLDCFDADAVDGHVVTGELGLTDGKGHPLCASVRPPRITWTVATPTRSSRGAST